MSSPFNLWKAAIGVVIYVIACIAILCFSGPDYAADSIHFTPCVAAHPATSEHVLKKALLFY